MEKEIRTHISDLTSFYAKNVAKSMKQLTFYHGFTSAATKI